jgi:hypothetical protein
VKLPLGCLALAYLSMVSSICAQTTGGNVATTTPATQAGTQSAAISQVPRLVKFSGTVQNFGADEAGGGAVARDSASVPTNVVGITFSLYSQQTGGGPLWSEVQNVRVDSTGHYTVQLGSTQDEGLPVELFSSAQAQWLGVRLEGQAEQPRIMLLSVPYALKAADAETFGGKPPSAFMSATNSAMASGSGGTTPGTNGKQPLPPQVDGGGTTNYIALWTSASDLGDSVMYQSSNNIGIGTTSLAYPLTVSGNNAGTIISVTQAGSGIGVNAYSYSTSGGGTAVLGKTQGNSGIGVRGDALASTGPTYGVYGSNASTSGYGVYGNASASTGNTYGVYGKVASTAGIALLGLATATSGNTIGVSGIVDSAAGTAGVFNNAIGGNILVGQNNGTAKFTVDGSGDVNISGNFTGSGSGLTGIQFSNLGGTLASSQFSGTFSNAVTLSNTSNVYYGNGSNLTEVVAGAGSPYYIQNTNSEQTNANFNIDGDGAIGGDLQVDGDGTIGGTFQAGNYQVGGSTLWVETLTLSVSEVRRRRLFSNVS